jgi:hypothetical protein
MPMKNRKVSLATAAFIRSLFVQCAADGELNASWLLNWPEQRASGVQPIMLQATSEMASITLIFEGQQFTTGR